MLPNKENVLQQNNQWSNRMEDSKPMDNSKKPLISPLRKPFQTQIQNLCGEQSVRNEQLQEESSCVNHPNKIAEFNIEIEDECLSYCGRCAAQLASQGFQVCKIDAPSEKRMDTGKNQGNSLRSRPLPVYREYEGNPMYESIIEFLTELCQVEG